MESMNKRQRFSCIILGFTLASFGGWIYEECCIYVLYHHLYNRGMLHLTLCPIYGFGALGLYALLRKINHTGLFFLLSTLIASVFEYACSYLLELIFHRSFWTYEGWILSVHNRISLISSLIFGILSVLYAKGLYPLLKKWMRKGNPNCWFAVSLIVLAAVWVILHLFCYISRFHVILFMR